MAKKEKKLTVEAHQLSTEAREVLSKGITAGVIQMSFIKSQQELLTTQIADLADQLGMDAGNLKKAIAAVYKQDFFDKVRQQDEVETILTVAGQLANIPTEEDDSE